MWAEVPKSKRQGRIQSFKVDYTSTTSNETKRMEVQAPTQHLEIDGLEQNTNYTITVMASTSKGYGPASEPIFVATDQDSKSKSALTFINACTGIKGISISCPMKHLRRALTLRLVCRFGKNVA